MLGKMMKYEWKSISKMGCLMLIVILFISILGWYALASLTPLWDMLDGGRSSSADYLLGDTLMAIFRFFALMMYVIMLAAVNFGTIIYLGVHFYKTMYTREGYLTHTLPVEKKHILGSKVIVSGLWLFIIMFCLYVSLLILGTQAIRFFLPEDYTFWELWRQIIPNMKEVIDELRRELGWNVVSWLVSLLITLIAEPFTTVIILFGAISLGQLFSRHRVFGAIICYLGILVAVNLFGSVFRNLFGVNLSHAVGETFGDYINFATISGNVLNILTAAVLYFVSYYVISRKLNLE